VIAVPRNIYSHTCSCVITHVNLHHSVSCCPCTAKNEHTEQQSYTTVVFTVSLYYDKWQGYLLSVIQLTVSRGTDFDCPCARHESISVSEGTDQYIPNAGSG
jgi:hypothetical protein